MTSRVFCVTIHRGISRCAMQLRRRSFGIGAATAVGAGIAAPGLTLAQGSGSNGPGREMAAILDQVRQLGLSEPQAAGTRSGGKPTAIDLAQVIVRSLEKGTSDRPSTILGFRASLLLSEITRDARDGADADHSGVSAASARYPFEALKGDYTRLLATAKVQSGLAELRRVSTFITSKPARERYQAVEAETKVPWYLIGALHYREASSNFLGHLHNGDPLLYPTVQVPADRPKPWPQGDVNDLRQLWLKSAVDASVVERFSSRGGDWSMERVCWACEAYNGFGVRDRSSNKVNSPYLWSYTDKYVSGGFPRDHVYEASYKSKQPGIMAILLTMREAGALPH